MTLPRSYDLATDPAFQLLAGYTGPPRAGVVTGIDVSGQVRVTLDDSDGGEAVAWPLNGFSYAVDDIVYLLFVADNPESAIVLGARSPLPALDAQVLNPFRLHDGTGGLCFATQRNIDGTAQTVIANGNGDVTHAVVGYHVTQAGGSSAAGALGPIAPGGSQTVTIGGDTFQYAVVADGSLTVQRSAGTNAGSCALLLVWL